MHVKNISRREGRSIVAAAAYRAGETLPNEAEERLSAFGGRRDVVGSEIRLPADAPSWMADRARLWNAVEAAEKRKDARLAKELEFSLPRELSKAMWWLVAKAMADAYTSQGFVADVAIHDDGTQHNPHVHILLTTRVVKAEGFGPKIRSADGLQFVTEARALWAQVANKALGDAGIAVTIDSRSHAERNLEQTPGRHRGPDREERRARRALAQEERELISSGEKDEDLPVPDPDGDPIHPRELEAAEERMLQDVERRLPDEPVRMEGDMEGARTALEQQNNRELTEDEAAAYRLAPDNQLDWLDDPAPPLAQQDTKVLDRWENHLDWLEPGQAEPAEGGEEIPQEPEVSR
nr:MobA/MobL family protein [Sinorhizobium saheli]